MFDAGILEFYTLKNAADPGLMPTEKLVCEGKAFYINERIGVTRAYAAMGAKQQIDAVVLAYNVTLDPAVEYVILEDGYQYRISLKQPEGDNVRLTLERLEELYDVKPDKD